MIWKLALTYVVLNITGTCCGQIDDNAIELLSIEIFLSERGQVFAIEKDESGIIFIKAGIPTKIIEQRNNRLYYTNATTYGRDSIVHDTLYYEFQNLENNQILVLSNYYYDKTIPMAEELFPQIFTPSEAEPIRLISFERAIKSKAYELKRMKIRDIKGKEVYLQYSPQQILVNYRSKKDTISLADQAIKTKILDIANDLAITYSKFGRDYPYKLEKDYIIEFDFITAYCGRDKLDEIVNYIQRIIYASNSKKNKRKNK